MRPHLSRTVLTGAIALVLSGCETSHAPPTRVIAAQPSLEESLAKLNNQYIGELTPFEIWQLTEGSESKAKILFDGRIVTIIDTFDDTMNIGTEKCPKCDMVELSSTEPYTKGPTYRPVYMN